MELNSDRPYTIVFARADLEMTAAALQRSMDAAGLRPAVGLAITSEQQAIDPHDRTRRYFRLRSHGDCTIVLEHGSVESADYFLPPALAAAGVKEIGYAALEPGGSSGVVATFHASRKPRELWIEAGAVDTELSTMDPGGRSPADIVLSWGAPKESPVFDDGEEEVLAFAGHL